MGPRVALSSVMEQSSLQAVCDFLVNEYPAFYCSRGGLDGRLSNEVQESIKKFAGRPSPQVPDWIWNPPIDVESLREFGEWCRDGCPVTVGSETYRYRYGDITSTTTPSSSSWERVCTPHLGVMCAETTLVISHCHMFVLESLPLSHATEAQPKSPSPAQAPEQSSLKKNRREATVLEKNSAVDLPQGQEPAENGVLFFSVTHKGPFWKSKRPPQNM